MSKLLRKKVSKKTKKKTKTANIQRKTSHKPNKDPVGKTNMPVVIECWVFVLKSVNKPAQR